MLLPDSKVKNQLSPAEYQKSGKRRYSLLLPIMLCLFLSSCAHLKHLDQAQDSFSEGAALENTLKLSTEASFSLSPAYHYNRAYLSVNKAIKGKGEKKLKQDYLLGHAYSLKALCAWKLKHYREAVVYGSKAKLRFLYTARQGMTMPRDLLMMRALPSIISIDTITHNFLAFRASGSATDLETSLNFYNTYIYSSDSLPPAQLQNALAEIELLKRDAVANPSLYAYLSMVQLSALKTWSGCLSMLFETSISRLSMQDKIKFRENILAEKQSSFNTQRDHLIQELESALEGEESKEKIVAYWKGIL